MPDPKVQTPAEMRALAEEHEREAARLTARARQLRHAADVVEALEREPVSEKSSLLFESQYGTNGDMHASTISKKSEPAPRARGRDITSESPVGAAATKLGMTLKQLAEKLDYSYDTVRKWSSKGSVPVDVQQKIDGFIASQAKRAGKSTK